MSAVSRREFMVSLVTLAGGAGLVLVIGCSDREQRTRELQIRLASILEDQDSAVLVGRKYLAQFPDDNRVDRLIDSLFPELRANTEVPEREAIEARLADAIGQDFEDGKTIFLSGWILSVTEVRLCALTALAESDPRADQG